ncbi:MAG: hypothetical protein HFG54_07145 [Lachnospiraceae bacterium]|nr:hypothetical protein [Lachnospiraceae bacterium]
MAINKEAKETVEVTEEKTRRTSTKAAGEKTEKKPAPKKAVAEKVEKKPRAVKNVAEKPAVKEPAEEKMAVRKTEEKKAEPSTSVTIQYGSGEVAAKKVVAAAIDAYKAAHEGVEVNTVEVYIKPEENAAYYVVNGDDSEGNNRIALF